jgi:signal transduction histidine kinase
MDVSTVNSSQAEIVSGRWQLLRGDRFYTFARWLILALLALVTSILSREPIWPLSAESAPLVWIFWGYVAFGVFATFALIAPPFNPLLHWAYLCDILFISLMALFGGEGSAIFFTLYLLPLIGAALRQQPFISFISGLFAAIFYITAVLIWRGTLGSGAMPSMLDYLAFTLQGVTLCFIPWITSGLAERWSANNRQSVAVAEEQRQRALAEAQGQRDKARALFEVASSLSSTMDYRHVLEATLRESRKLVAFRVGAVLLSTGRHEEVYIAAGEGLEVTDQNRQLPVSRGQLAQALRSPDPQVIADVGQEPDLQVLTSLRGCRSACIIPMRANMRTYGLLLVASERPAAFNGEELDMLTTLASYAIVAMLNAQLIFDLKEERNKLISKEEAVRHQLARDLHDGPAQSLAAITMNLEFIKRLLERDPSRVPEELDKLSQLSKRTTYEVRTMLFELRPLVLETQGLRVTLEQYLERFKGNNNGSQILLDTEGVDEIQLDTKTEGTLFNIIQEAVNNALKHARAKHIWVRMRRDGAMLTTIVRDDGIGFDKTEVMRTYERRGSFGLLNIDERARLVGGHANLESEPGKGTVITIVVPIEQP